jgi:hypothetical protein
MKAKPNHRLHTDLALRASTDGRSRFAWFLSRSWFQADVRAERVKRTFGQQHNLYLHYWLFGTLRNELTLKVNPNL